MKKILLALTILLAFSANMFAIEVLAGGQVPLINSVTGIGVTSLDFASPGSDVPIAQFIISNNSTSFDLAFEYYTIRTGGAEFTTFAFERSTGAIGTVDVTSLELVATGSGTLGSGLTEITEGSGVDCILSDAAWEPGDQETATEFYVTELRASWDASTSLLAGLYVTKIRATLTAHL